MVLLYLISNLSYAQLYNEKYRPQYHFSPSTSWIGDPCGFAYIDSTYHLLWWGKATSTDLVHFDQKNAFAMKGDPGGFGYFTGSAVLDKNNTAGFGADKLITIYTMALPGNQAVGISYSADQSYDTFQYYEGNPVLDLGNPEFRDPTVIWHEESSKWIMVIVKAVDRVVQFYSSTDLKSWTWMSDFGPVGAVDQIWECPDFFELAVDGNPNKKKWVLQVSMGPNKGQYFVGYFDGTTFKMDTTFSNYLLKGNHLIGDVYDSFNRSSYGSWAVTGSAFGASPAEGTLSGQQNVSGFLGSKLINSFNGGDGSTGTLTSPTFTITENNINFLIGGGDHPGQTCINLLINGQVVETATGHNSEILKWSGWNVTSYIGQQAQLQIVDSNTGSWGHILIDHIMFSDMLHQENREHALWVDYGSDFYAARAVPDFDGTLNSTSWFGWVSNWEYAHDVPGWNEGGKGQWSIARNLSLKTYSEGVRLVQEPVPALQSLRQTPVNYSGTICGTNAIPGFSPSQNTYEIDATFSTDVTGKFGFNLLVGDGRKLVIGYDTRTQVVFIDRTNCTDATINGNFAKSLFAPVEPVDDELNLRIFVDKSTVEVFANSGKKVLTVLTFPSENQIGVEVFSDLCNGTSIDFTAWMLNSIWKDNYDFTPNLTYNFESGDLSGWTVLSGDAFTDADVTSDMDWGWGGPFNQQGTFHLWNYKDGGDSQVGVIRTQDFVLGGNGQITFLQGGGDDINNLYVSLVRSSDNVELMKSTGNNDEGYSAKSFNAASYVGELCYIKVVDNATGGWGHINIDDIQIPQDILTPGIYKIVNQNSNKVLDVDTGGSYDGAPVQQWEYLGGDNQKWLIEPSSEYGFYTITSVSGNRVLDSDGASDGSSLQVWSSLSGDNQKWKIKSAGDGVAKILSKISGRSLEVESALDDNGSKIQLWTFAANSHQQWRLELLEATGQSSARVTDEEERAVIDELNSTNQINIYPVPSEGQLTVDLTAFAKEASVVVEIIDMTGKTVNRIETKPTKVVLKKSELGIMSGIYLVRVQSSNHTATSRIIFK